MGCFFACFGSSKDPKRLKNHRKSRHTDHRSTIQRNEIPTPGQSSLHTLPVDSNKKSLHPVEARRDGSLNISTTEELTSVKPHEHEHVVSVHGMNQDLEEDSVEKSSKPESSSEDFVVPLNPNFRSPFPPVHRYRNCKDSDDEDDVFDSHLGRDENDEFGTVESMKESSSVADSSMSVSRLNPTNVRHRTAYVCPVLKPVENLSQWNAVKSKSALPSTPQKENLELEQESTGEEFPYSSKASQELCVDASLSNWLASSEATPVSKITTTMALEAIVTPVKSSTLQGSSSQSSSHSELPVVRNVVIYRRQGASDKDRDSASSFKGIPNTTSKYREDKTVNWHSTPFETRLERALNSRGVAKA
ncbi:protein JASON-like [Cucurbita pepo subsp. pepo]|uniref:protein JASON-like n=1 Tax=Cucurbita pepo subsp. pepo TaxID=3664 RepID=UPI000C9D3C4A|nr:protein JASON-like [Cucurbita pepo subsp. pepo]XP_023548185.1 protein JASON-like [Cucurbita pepo subsp. pepo]